MQTHPLLNLPCLPPLTSNSKHHKWPSSIPSLGKLITHKTQRNSTMMSSNPKNLKISPRKSHRRIRRRSTIFSRRRRAHAAVRACKAHQRRRSIGKGAASSSKVSDKLEALKNLINPDNRGGELVKADQLFQDTADYIVLLRTQVFVLQRLIEFYGSSAPTAAAAAAATTTK